MQKEHDDYVVYRSEITDKIINLNNDINNYMLEKEDLLSKIMKLEDDLDHTEKKLQTAESLVSKNGRYLGNFKNKVDFTIKNLLTQKVEFNIL